MIRFLTFSTNVCDLNCYAQFLAPWLSSKYWKGKRVSEENRRTRKGQQGALHPRHQQGLLHRVWAAVVAEAAEIAPASLEWPSGAAGGAATQPQCRLGTGMPAAQPGIQRTRGPGCEFCVGSQGTGGEGGAC